VLGSPAHHDEILRDGTSADPADAALEADRRDVMLAAPIRAAADLDPRPIGRRDQVGASAEMVFEQTAQAARLCHRKPARFGAGAAGDVGNRACVRESETGSGETSVKGTHITRLHPTTRICALVMSPSGTVTSTIA
jgi:hypothetical protein